MKYAKKIRKERLGRGITQVNLAKLLGISQATMSKLENGETMPKAEVWLRFCRKFGLDPMLGGAE